MEFLTLAYPPLFALLAMVALWVFPRNVGHALGVVLLVAVAGVSGLVPAGEHLPVTLFAVFEAELFAVDAASRLMGVVFGIVGAGAVLYAWDSEATAEQTAIALSYVAVSLGAVLAGDWLTLVLYWELMAVTSTALVWHHGTSSAIRAGYRYAVLHGIGGSLLLAAIIGQFILTGSMAITPNGIVGGLPALAAAVGIGVNVGFLGLHTWLPDTYPRPHFAASVFLSVYTTKTGVYTLYRAFPEGELAIAYMGGAMALFGAAAAVLQDDMRRMLSYSIQSQVGYMVAAIGAGGVAATAGTFGHIFNHILYKALLFMVAGVIIYRTGKERLQQLGGLARQMPLTTVAFVVGALSIAGLPGFSGFISKGLIFDAAAHIGHGGKVLGEPPLWWILTVAAVGTSATLAKFGYFAFLRGPFDGSAAKATSGQSIAMGMIALLCVGFGLFPDWLYLLIPGAEAAPATLPLVETLSGIDYTAYTVGHAVEAVLLAGIGLISMLIARRPLRRLGQVPDIDWLLNRSSFYSTRGVVVFVTELFSVVDRLARRLAMGAMAVGTDPETALRQTSPGQWFLDQRGDWQTPLRPGISESIAILVLILTVLLVSLLIAL